MSISTVLGNNGIIPKANEAKFKTDLASIQEEFTLYVTDKTAENSDFSVGSLNASKDLLTYNTQPEEEKGTGNISSILKSSVAQKYVQNKSFSIIKGDLIYASQNAKELEWAQEIGLAINPYNIDENGVLLSSETNLMLMDEVTGTLVIPEMVTAIGEGTFGQVDKLKKLIIPSTVVEIQNNAFRGNTSLEEVIIQSDEQEGKGLKKIGANAFYECKNLKSIVIPNTVTDIGIWAFGYCSGLKNIKLSSNANINGAEFGYCTALEEINIPEGVQKIQDWGSFCACTSLKTIYIPSTMQSISSTAFYECANITKIILAENSSSFILENGILLSGNRQQMIFVTKSALDESGIFYIPEGVTALPDGILGSFRLQTVIIPASVTGPLSGRGFPESVSKIQTHENNPQYTIYNGNVCSKDKKKLFVCLNKTNTVNVDEGIESIGKSAFRTSPETRTVIFPNSVTTLENQIFEGSLVQNVRFGTGLKNINSEAFDYSTMKSIEISSDNPNYVAENGAIYSKDKQTLIRLVQRYQEEFTVPSTVIRIETKAFSFCLCKTINIPNTVRRNRNKCFQILYKFNYNIHSRECREYW